MSTDESSEKKPQTKDEEKEASETPRRVSSIEPYEPREMVRSFDRIFDNFRRNFEELVLLPSDWMLGKPNRYMSDIMHGLPPMDLEDRGEDFCLTVEVPGFEKEDLQIEVEEGIVDVSGSRSMKEQEKTERYVRKERGFQSFHRRLRLPEEVAADKVEANMTNGVLEVVLPKKHPKPRTKVTIK
ncbi:MAG: Hsp20/alpha crystallin family protein [Candidatus Bathyarchaeota archaeon]|nr:Hsp20/alpha crystallin family protein [Candidatus Bathyarchaeota archaeon]